MNEKSRYDWQQLRVWRVIGVVSFAILPFWLLGLLVARELYDVPITAKWLIGLPIILGGAAAMKVATFECPACGRDFAKHPQTGTHLTSKRCMSCGLAVGT